MCSRARACGSSGAGGAPPSPPPPFRILSFGDEDQPPRVASAILASAILFAVAVPWARRGIRFWLGVFPILLSYLFLFLRTRNTTDDARALRFAALHDAMAPKALKIITGLSGGYVKMGQVLANRADTLPAAYVRAFGTLHSSVPPRPWSRMERSLRRDAPALAGALREVNETALGAASTGQAHLATLRDGSRYPPSAWLTMAAVDALRLTADTTPLMVISLDELRLVQLSHGDPRLEGFAQTSGGVVCPVCGGRPWIAVNKWTVDYLRALHEEMHLDDMWPNLK